MTEEQKNDYQRWHAVTFGSFPARLVAENEERAYLKGLADGMIKASNMANEAKAYSLGGVLREHAKMHLATAEGKQ